ncbi:hypothetical protein B296_00025659 [Ensete ventricosum]|uniref:Uncharacterized protein n=1 Tax=Ensete ventricosum TaxID=4639 RepID=A0A426XJB3_ENSVE|nr:hypothetical protein B296_00025659 [Ensete ventricosum]
MLHKDSLLNKSPAGHPPCSSQHAGRDRDSAAHPPQPCMVVEWQSAKHEKGIGSEASSEGDDSTVSEPSVACSGCLSGWEGRGSAAAAATGLVQEAEKAAPPEAARIRSRRRGIHTYRIASLNVVLLTSQRSRFALEVEDEELLLRRDVPAPDIWAKIVEPSKPAALSLVVRMKKKKKKKKKKKRGVLKQGSSHYAL